MSVILILFFQTNMGISPWLDDVIDDIDWSQTGGWRLPTHMGLLRPLGPLVDAKL
jgi:hypothetical protein